MAQPKKTKETKFRQTTVTLSPEIATKKDALMKEGMSISAILSQAIERTYDELNCQDDQKAGG